MSRIALPVLILLALVPAFTRAEPVVVERPSVLRSEPRVDAASLGELPQGTTGDAIARQGAWVQIRTGAATGWLYSFNVRFGAIPQGGAGDGADAVLGRIFSPRQRPSVTSTIGIRGLDEKDLRQAQFDPGQVRQLEAFAASRGDAQAHAGDAGLGAQRLDYLGGGGRE